MGSLCGRQCQDNAEGVAAWPSQWPVVQAAKP